ncbi:hypothetical protein CUMW_159880 [Citrus unshiu]|nr:hypothetical protein CUMW_159880 [Citrus unshiu]
MKRAILLIQGSSVCEVVEGSDHERSSHGQGRGFGFCGVWQILLLLERSSSKHMIDGRTGYESDGDPKLCVGVPTSATVRNGHIAGSFFLVGKQTGLALPVGFSGENGRGDSVLSNKQLGMLGKWEP